jgi:hypothetical protein
MELRTSREKVIALKMLEKYAAEKTLTIYNPRRSLRMAVIVEASDADLGRLLRAHAALSRIDHAALRRKVFKELAENPSLKRLEQVLALTKLIEV